MNPKNSHTTMQNKTADVSDAISETLPSTNTTNMKHIEQSPPELGTPETISPAETKAPNLRFEDSKNPAHQNTMPVKESPHTSDITHKTHSVEEHNPGVKPIKDGTSLKSSNPTSFGVKHSTLSKNPDGADACANKIEANTPPESTSAQDNLHPIEKEEGPFLDFGTLNIHINYPSIAEEFTSEERVAYSETTKTWLQYNTQEGIWETIDENQLRQKMSDHLKKLSRKKNAPKLLFKRTRSVINSILDFAKGCAPFHTPDAQRQLLPVNNGVLDLTGDTPVLREYSSNDWFSNKMPINWNPDADCEKWQEFLLNALGNENDVNLLQRATGSMLIPGNPAQLILMLHGIGGSGKTTAISVLENVFGINAVAHLRPEKLKGNFESYFYLGKNLLVGKDVAPDYLQKGGHYLKSLTGNDFFESERKYGGKCSQRGNYNVIITANQPPLLAIQSDDGAWYRRFITIQFSSKPSKRIPNFDQVLLREEGSGILNWLVQGYLASRVEITAGGFFALTDAQIQRTQDYVDASQSDVVFVRNQIIAAAEDEDCDCTTQEIYESYVMTCKARNWPIISEHTFQKKLGDQMIISHNAHKRHDILRAGKASRGFKRVKIVPLVG